MQGEGQTSERAADGPLAVVRLPDGQVVTAVVRGRRQERDSTWWYVLELPLYSREQAADGRLTPLPEPVEFIAPATGEVVMPMPGEDYREVTTWRDPGVVRREARRRHLGRPHEPLPWET